MQEASALSATGSHTSFQGARAWPGPHLKRCLHSGSRFCCACKLRLRVVFPKPLQARSASIRSLLDSAASEKATPFVRTQRAGFLRLADILLSDLGLWHRVWWAQALFTMFILLQFAELLELGNSSFVKLGNIWLVIASNTFISLSSFWTLTIRALDILMLPPRSRHSAYSLRPDHYYSFVFEFTKHPTSRRLYNHIHCG